MRPPLASHCLPNTIHAAVVATLRRATYEMTCLLPGVTDADHVRQVPTTARRFKRRAVELPVDPLQRVGQTIEDLVAERKAVR